jgi:hypothetical protein
VAESVRGVAGIVGMLAGVFIAEYSKGIPQAGDPVRVIQVVLNGVMVQGGVGGTGRWIHVGTVSVVDGCAGDGACSKDKEDEA